jgi:hypothetical protein
MKSIKKKPSELDIIRKTIRDLEHWSWYGNTANDPGGRFKKRWDFILAVRRVTRFAKQTIERREKMTRIFNRSTPSGPPKGRGGR